MRKNERSHMGAIRKNERVFAKNDYFYKTQDKIALKPYNTQDKSLFDNLYLGR